MFSKLIGNCHPARKSRVSLHHQGGVGSLAARGQQGLWNNSRDGTVIFKLFRGRFHGQLIGSVTWPLSLLGEDFLDTNMYKS